MSNGAKRFNPPGTRFPGMSQAIRCGDWIMVSGQVALHQGKVVGIGDPTAQARQCFVNIASALAEAGATMEDVVSVRCYLTDKAAYSGYAEIKNVLFANHPPASTSVVIDALLLPDLLMEIEAVAWTGPA
jgi:2-iminobutanoate/2-iminopropanoate deaminase